MVISTPYMDEAERCSAIGLMYEGRLVVSGTPAEIKRLVTGEIIEVCPQGAGQGVNLLHIIVEDAARGMPVVAQALRSHGIEPAGLRTTTARMEQAFIWLIRRQQGLGEGTA